jgi:hypothetical protein
MLYIYIYVYVVYINNTELQKCATTDGYVITSLIVSQRDVLIITDLIGVSQATLRKTLAVIVVTSATALSLRRW